MKEQSQRGAQIFTKKGIIGMFETILVVFVIIIFLVVGLVIYVRLQGYSTSSESSAITELRALRVQHSAITMPEFTCEACGGSLKDRCFDTLKLEAFTKLPATTIDGYYSYFGKSSLVVEQIYPEEKSWTLYNKKGEGNIQAHIPVLLCDPEKNNYNFGVLIIDVSLQ